MTWRTSFSGVAEMVRRHIGARGADGTNCRARAAA